VIVAADCYAAVRLATAGEIYAHTRSSVVKTAVDSAGPSNAIVLYVNDAAWATFFALIYDYHAGLRQYIAKGSTVKLIVAPVETPSVTICDLKASTLLVADDQELSAETLQFLIDHPRARTQAYRALEEFLEAHHADLAVNWTLVSRNEYLAQSALALAVFKRRTVDVSATSTNCNARQGASTDH
jgi:hypothetical protein